MMNTEVPAELIPGTPDRAYIQRVRRHRPSDLLPVIAALGAKFVDRDSWLDSPGSQFNPWTLADITRVSLAYSNEHRSNSVVTEKDVLECARMYFGFVGKDLEKATPDAATNAILRMAAEQLPYQQLDLNHMARAAAILLQTGTTKPLQVLNQNWEQELFGCTLVDYVGIGQLLVASAQFNNGVFDPDWLAQPQMSDVLERISAKVILRTLARHYVISADQFRELNSRFHQPGDLRRYSFNPLVTKPVIHGFGTRMLIPVPNAVLLKFGMLGIYHIGMETFGKSFAVDLGHLFEQYVGRQLKLIPDAEVISEISYGTRKAPRYSIDWIVILPSAVLLIEAKSVRPTDAVRLASPSAKDELSRMLRRPLEQIQTTEDQIVGGNAEFSGIPTDRPHIGLAVTLEPFDIANSLWLRDVYRPPMTILSAVISINELEHLVSLVDTDIAELMLKHLTNPATDANTVGSSMFRLPSRRNPIIDQGFAAYPWRHANGDLS